MVAQIKETPTKRSIEKAQIDWPSTKTQMTLAALLIIVSCFVAYGSTLKMGFLLDDFLHLDYAARALTGEVGPLVNNFVSNWGGSDIMKSYRPIISLSIFIDYLLYHTHAFGFHLTNLLAFCACSVMVAMITLEITGRLGARSGALTALWAGLLFSVYPLHAESVAWIIGRVDTVATAFYLASLFCFLRLELLREKIYLVRSLAFFLLALTSKETAVSLPVAVALLACLPRRKVEPRQQGTPGPVDATENLARLVRACGRKMKDAFLASLPYWLLLAMYALFRQALLGTAVGGYGGAGLGDVLHSLRIFADKDSLTKIFVPISEEYLPIRVLAPYCLAPIVVVTVSFLARQLTLFVRGEHKAPPLLTPPAIIFWLALALVPAFQIWHIYPNLVGSRLFFLSSAGLCMAVAMLALPTAEPIGKKLFSIFAIPSLVALSALYFVWFYALQINLGAWQKASSLVESFETQVRTTVLGAGQNQTVILNLPQDYKGAGMVGRKLYLDILNRPPLLGLDLSQRLTVLEPKITGSRDYIWPSELASTTKSAGPSNVYIWSNKESTLKHFETSLKIAPVDGHPNLAGALEQELNKLPVLQAGRWQTVDKDKAVVKKSSDNWSELSMPENNDQGKDTSANIVTIWLPGQVDPRKPENWLLRFDVEDDGGIGMASKCQAIWRNCTDKELVGAANPYLERHHGQYLFDLGRYRSYLLSPNALELGLRFRLADGAVRFKPATLQLGSEANLVPQLTLDSKTNTINWDARAIIKNDKTKSLNEVRFFVTKPGTTIDPSIELDLYQPSALEKATPDLRLPLADTNGAGSLPLSKLMEDVPQSGQGTISQVVMVVADKTGKTITLPSQPLTVGPGTSRRLY